MCSLFSESLILLLGCWIAFACSLLGEIFLAERDGCAWVSCLWGIFLARRDATLGLPLGEYFNSSLLHGFEFIWDRLGGSGPYVLCKAYLLKRKIYISL